MSIETEISIEAELPTAPLLHVIGLGDESPVEASVNALPSLHAALACQQDAGQRVALAISDTLMCVDAFFSALGRGDTPVVINPRMPMEQALRLAADTGCSSLQIDSQTLTLPHSVITPAQKGHHIFCTSGTTSTEGLPKTFTFALANSVANARAHMASIDVVENGRSRILLPLPVTHTFGMVAGVIGALSYGADLFLTPATLSVQGLLAALDIHAIDTLYLTPSLALQLLNALNRKPLLRPLALARISIGSSITHGHLLLGLMKHFPDTRFYVTYGLTEMGPRVSTFVAGSLSAPSPALAGQEDAPAPLGTPLPGVELRIQADSLWIRSPYRATLLDGLNEGYFNTQDQASVDEQGEIRIHGRQDDTIIRAGINIYPDDVESKLINIDGISALSLVASPSRLYGQVPTLVCETALGASHHPELEAAIHVRLKATLPDTHWPARIAFVTHIPRTALGKIQRKRVAQLLGELDRG